MQTHEQHNTATTLPPPALGARVRVARRARFCVACVRGVLRARSPPRARPSAQFPIPVMPGRGISDAWVLAWLSSHPWRVGVAAGETI